MTTMDPWGWSAYIGILFGTVAFLFLLVPVLGYQYRRYGQFTPRRALGAAAVSIYGTSLLAYTLLPLPASRGEWCSTSAVGAQWRPFHFVTDVSEVAAAAGPFEVLSSRVTLQVLFNVVLFLPWGVFVRAFWGRSTAVAAATGLLASLAIELTQLTGVWGAYECAYRVGDVDDLLTNTLGAFLGAALAPWILWWMPRPHAYDATRRQPRPVTNARRWLGMALDLVAFTALGFALVVGHRLVDLATTGRLEPDPGLGEAALATIVPAALVFVLPAWRGSGASLGQRAVRLVPVWSYPPSASRRLSRALAVGGTYAVLELVSQWRDGSTWGDAAQQLANLLLLVAFVAVPLTGRRGLSGVLTGARFEDERDRPALRRDPAPPP